MDMGSISSVKIQKVEISYILERAVQYYKVEFLRRKI